MKYKAIFLDVDGTILPYNYDSYNQMPRDRTKKAIREASKKLMVCLATGRPLFMLEDLIKNLDLTKGYAIINDGAQVVDIATKEVLYKNPIPEDDITKIAKILAKEGVPFFLNDGLKDYKNLKISKKREILNIFTLNGMELSKINYLVDIISNIPTIHISKTHFGKEDKYELLISSQSATKLHGVIFVSKLMKFKREETIGVGDSGNDFQLLMSCGLKIAMGNAIEDLKQIADYVAPSVDDDGLEDVINKFILEK